MEVQLSIDQDIPLPPPQFFSLSIILNLLFAQAQRVEENPSPQQKSLFFCWTSERPPRKVTSKPFPLPFIQSFIVLLPFAFIPFFLPLFYLLVFSSGEDHS